MDAAPRPVVFEGSSLEDLRAFPPLAKREAGYQLDRLQNGLDPNDWKTMTSVGAGVREIRIQESDGAFRVIYAAKFASGIHVLHCFRKTTRKTGQADIELAAKRYRTLIREQKQ